MHTPLLPLYHQCNSNSNVHICLLLLINLAVTTQGMKSEVRGKFGGVVELECSFPPPDPAAGSSAALHVVEWVRQGFDIPVLIKFGSYAPRVHPQYEGEHRSRQHTIQLYTHTYFTCSAGCRSLHVSVYFRLFSARALF